jgi:hypothetical protein
MKPQEQIISQLKDGYGIKENSAIAISIRLAFEKLQKENEEFREVLRKATNLSFKLDKKNTKLKERVEELESELNGEKQTTKLSMKQFNKLNKQN